MNRIFKTLFISALFIQGIFYFSCQKNKERTVNHIVLLWFNDSEKPGIISEAMSETLNLRNIKEVKSIHLGQPLESSRDIVDSSFDLGIEMKFNSKEDMNKYLENPLHKNFFNNFIKNKTKKIVVYDF